MSKIICHKWTKLKVNRRIFCSIFYIVNSTVYKNSTKKGNEKNDHNYE